MTQLPIVVVLAGGASSRMWPLREKSLLRFGTETLLISQLQRFRKLGLTRIVVVANPGNQHDIAALVEPLREASEVHIVVQPEARGMGDALLQTAPQIPPHAPIYVTQVHDVVDEQLHVNMLAAYRADPASTYLAGYEYDGYFPGGYLKLDAATARIIGIVEKPGPDNKPSNLVNIVAHMHPDSSRLFDAIRYEYGRDLSSDDHYERAMDTLMKSTSYRVVPYRGPWSALKYPWHVLDVMNDYLSRIDGPVIADTAFIASTASISGNVYIGPGAKIFPGAAVVGPAYIGAGTVLGNNSLVRGSMVLNHCEVGFTTEVARSYVSDHCAMHACRVLDSIFAERVNFSAGCTTANLRIDRGMVSSVVKGQKVSSGRDKLGAIIGREAFIAVDAMTMPGVKIGERAQIGPGTHVRFDVLDDAKVYVRQEIVIDDGRN
jgi:bifunctional UDP-N-acetylglucosamine pyrophosphorylase/glucosamine-1-phosphate N-acetyltransferase